MTRRDRAIQLLLWTNQINRGNTICRACIKLLNLFMEFTDSAQLDETLKSHSKMGQTIQRLKRMFVEDVRILMLGLDGAGKTTILYRLKLGQYVRTTPTIGFNVETLSFKSCTFMVWDVGGQDQIRHLWSQYPLNAQAIIFVVDSSDTDEERIKVARKELHNMLENVELGTKTKLLILANKHDMPNAMRVSEAIEKLHLDELQPHCGWHIQRCSAKTGDGLIEGLSWLAKATKQNASTNIPFQRSRSSRAA